MSIKVKRSNGEVFVEVADGQTNTTDSAVALVGKGAPGYVEAFANNFYHLMEHFASEDAPCSPQTGMIWYDLKTKVLKLYDGLNWQKIALASDIDNEAAETGIARMRHASFPDVSGASAIGTTWVNVGTLTTRAVRVGTRAIFIKGRFNVTGTANRYAAKVRLLIDGNVVEESEADQGAFLNVVLDDARRAVNVPFQVQVSVTTMDGGAPLPFTFSGSKISVLEVA